MWHDISIIGFWLFRTRNSLLGEINFSIFSLYRYISSIRNRLWRIMWIYQSYRSHMWLIIMLLLVKLHSTYCKPSCLYLNNNWGRIHHHNPRQQFRMVHFQRKYIMCFFNYLLLISVIIRSWPRRNNYKFSNRGFNNFVGLIGRTYFEISDYITNIFWWSQYDNQFGPYFYRSYSFNYLSRQ